MNDLKKAINQINSANPYWGKLFNCEESLIDYAKNDLNSYNPIAIHLERQKGYLQEIKLKINELFTDEDLKINYQENMIIDTADHHNVLNYPATIGAHLISRFDTLLDRKAKGDYYVLDSGNVTFSEELHKRGVEFSGKHVNLYPKSTKNKLISRYSLYDFNLIEKFKNSGHQFNKDETKFIENLQEIIDNIDFSTCKRFSDQIVKINFYLWQEFFDQDIRDNIRRCVTLEHDEILINYLSNFLLENQENFIWKMLFDIKFRENVLEGFDGIYGAWNYSGENTGTHFFWGFNEETGKECRMKIQNNKLINEDGLIADINLYQENIVSALKDGTLIPSIFTKFSFVAFYLGIKTMGGASQTDYTNKMHKVWLQILKDNKDNEYANVAKASVLNMNCGDVAFRREDNKVIREWGFDIAMRKRFTKSYLENLGKTKFKYLVYPFIPIAYNRFVDNDKRESLTFDQKDLYEGFNWIK